MRTSSESHSRTIAALFATALALCGAVCAEQPPPKLPPLPETVAAETLSFRGDVAPVLERRCVVCHGCYDAPCQLLLSSREGVERGASKQAVYRSDRLTEADPTRLFIDAHTTEQWRARGFVSVTDGAASGPPASPMSVQPLSLLEAMLALGRARPFPASQKLPAGFPLAITRALSCPTSAEFDRYAAEHPDGGMPYGMARLADDELSVLAAWAAGERPAEAPVALPPRVTAQVARWEAFLNGESLKQRITARYLFEHWFLAHLYFEDVPDGVEARSFFRVVRSKTPPGAELDEIASRRPYDPPGVERFWYRLRPVESAIVHKTHIVYPLSNARLLRLEQLFLESDWEPDRLPSYEVKEASNAFVSFDQIPARARYQFLLDDAQYFLMTFIRGPVCRGQVAVDVIEDHFFVVFLDPDSDLTVVDSDYLERTKELLSLPAEHGSELRPGGLWLEYAIDQRRYLDVRQEAYDRVDPQRLGPTLSAIWDGDGSNPNALLTVFRNFDNATVVRGFLGADPKTAWVMDFPLFERIYYDLVAAFDVFGNVTHQVSTRLYMDHLRMQSENLFLAFLPEARREEIRASWYVGATDTPDYHVDALRSLGHGTQMPYATADPVRELLERIEARNATVAGPPDLLNRCDASQCDRSDATAAERRAERALRPLAGVRGPWVAKLPELSIVRVRAPVSEGGDVAYALARNRAHTNVASMFREDERLEPEKDTVTVVRGTLGSYPNFAFAVDVAQIEAFAAELAAVGSDADFELLVQRWGVRRTSPRFWETVDWLHTDFRHREPVEAGLFDLNRYENL